MNINDLLKENVNVQLVINSTDLREVFLTWYEEAKKREIQKETYLSPKKTAEMLGVNASTLWRWDKTGYFKKIKVGNAVKYRLSDINKLMDG